MRIPKYKPDGTMFPNSNFKTDTFYKKVNLSEAIRIGGEVLLNAIRQMNNSRLALMENGFVFIKNIFLDNWAAFKEKYKKQLSRDAIIDNVEKFLNCENMEAGFRCFKCPNGCGIHIQCFTCKSRICPKCGKVYRDRRTAKIASKLIKAPHRQFVFTIPEEYRDYFRKYRYLLNALYKSVNDAFNICLLA